MKKIEDKDKKLYGDYAVLLVGFKEDNHDKLIKAIKEFNEYIKIVFAKRNDYKKKLKDIFLENSLYGYSENSIETKAVKKSRNNTQS